MAKIIVAPGSRGVFLSDSYGLKYVHGDVMRALFDAYGDVGSKRPVCLIKAVSGQTTDQIAARVAADVDATAPHDWMLVIAGTNDVNNGASLATFQARVTTLMNNIAAGTFAAKMNQVLVGGPILVNNNGGNRAPFNSAMKLIVEAAGAVYCPLWENYQAYLAGGGGSISIDGLHPTTSGGPGKTGQQIYGSFVYPSMSPQ